MLPGGESAMKQKRMLLMAGKKSFAAIRTKNIQLMDNSTVHFGHGVEIITAHGRKFKGATSIFRKKHQKLKVISFFFYLLCYTK
ncbi:hypothetical protein LMF32_04975 [Desemzia sp. C1]|uniref:hypothetical protein n=1 Tax=Desemzia sp. C1 TaxID=2892016 RepID=UPI001E349124|nr:hypothetical protein [Desemzia sp. C1]MCI3028457.1 hypothetical protein [Desemzia sp. C1]